MSNATHLKNINFNPEDGGLDQALQQMYRAYKDPNKKDTIGSETQDLVGNKIVLKTIDYQIQKPSKVCLKVVDL